MIIAISLSACGTTTTKTVLNEWYTTNVNPNGSTSYDPPNGDWIFIRNEPLAAQRQFEREGGWKGWGDPNPPKY
tara:strand:+ start:590 stop:811 length:222 start_codon:yes stop_codon:yes gene_type:complete